MLVSEKELESGQVQPRTRAVQQKQTTFPSLLQMAQAAKKEVQAIHLVSSLPLPLEEEIKGTIWSYLKKENVFYKVTNFNKDTLLDLYCSIVPIFLHH